MKTKMMSKLLVFFLAMMMILSGIGISAFAETQTNDSHENQVRVIVENTTSSKSETVSWDGTLCDSWVDIEVDKTKSQDTAMSCILKALDAKSFTHTVDQHNMITEINGLKAGDGGEQSGWVGTLNDWFSNDGFGDIKVSDGKLEGGDEIRLMYSLDYGADCGGTWENNDKTLKDLTFSSGTLDKTFNKDTKEYTLTIQSNVSTVKVLPTASNKNFQARTSVGETTYKRNAEIPVSNGTVITVKDGDPNWPSMNNGEYGGGENVPAETYTITVQVSDPKVTLNLVPNTVDLEFYIDAEAKTELSKDKVEDKKIVTISDGREVHQYVLSLTSGTYAYRGKDGTTDLGGDTFTVADKDMEMTLVRNNWYYNSTVLNNKDDYSFTLKGTDYPQDMVLGTPYTESNKLYTPTLMVGGVQYSGTVALAEKWLDDYYLGTLSNKSTQNSKYTKTAQTQTLPINQYKRIKLTAPTDATTTFYKQEANYVVSIQTPDSKIDNQDGTTTYEFKSTSTHSNFQYRVMKEGQVTQAGYLADGNDIKVSFPEDRKPSDTTSTLAYDDRSVLLNIDDSKDTNELAMNVGDSFKVRAWRDAWQIVNSTTANQMIEPDFHYTVISGNDVVSVTPTTASAKGEQYTSGNATANWANVTALKEGVAIVAVTYDAIDINTGSTFNGTYGASAPERAGVFVVNVGSDTNIAWHPVSSDGDWDAELDTVYYAGNQGEFVIKPEGVTALSVQNVCGTKAGEVKNITAEADGAYKVPVTSGSNVIAATTENGTDYMIVRAKKVEVTVKNNTTGQSGTIEDAPAIKTGDSVTISIDRLDMPVPKMSGIYNPGYLSTAKTFYTLNNQYGITSSGTQYDFATPEKSSVTFTAQVAGTNTLEGFISLSSMGDDFGNHRNTDDNGRKVNTNASEKFGKFGQLPAISFEVTQGTDKPSYEELTDLSAVSIMAGNTYNNGFKYDLKESKILANNATAWTKTTSVMAADYMKISAIVTPKSYYNTMELRYWYEGEEPQTVPLTAGVATTLNDCPRIAEKLLNIEVRVTPADTGVGGTRIYSCLVYPNTSMKCIHPIIKNLTATSQEGDAINIINDDGGNQGIAYTSCHYTLDNQKNAKTITLDAEMFQLSKNKKTDRTDGVVMTKYLAGKQVGEAVTIQNNEGNLSEEEATNPTGTWKAENIDISACDTIKLDVTSFVDGNITRTYTLNLIPDLTAPVTISADKTFVEKDGTFKVTLSYDRAFNTFDFDLGWNNEKVEFISADWAEALKDNVVINSETEKMRIYSNAALPETVTLKDGKMATLTFKAKEIGDTDFDLTVTEMSRNNETGTMFILKPEIDNKISDGIHAYIRGDVNQDGRISIVDANRIQLYLAKKIDLTPTEKAAARVTDDPLNVRIQDVNRIQVFLAHFIEAL